ncbi:aldehyde oxidase GLOX1-like [Gastrolobium bilobum]|uniref:aldehyde oxidase GLOX1-like n=1 Tax=Gastrolobium bilobum TaxID=150636 RepID=UPI002AB25A23|nr:aldehyde oxidase GLOX1-like [Gastrolobium bilobum]
MAPFNKVLMIFTFLFLAFVDARLKSQEFRMFTGKPKFPIPFPIFGSDDDTGNNYNDQKISQGVNKPDFETQSIGRWEVISQESGVSAMQINLMPTNKIVVYDATVYRVSRLKYPKGVPCVPFKNENTKQQLLDCFAHSMEYDIETNQVRPLKVTADPWCSCGGLTPDGTLVSAGGFADGGKTIRYVGGGNCKDKNCDWREYNNKLKEERWYGSQAILATGDYIVIGGRRSFSYEFIPTKEGQAPDKPYFFPFLYETSDIDENNLYPFAHLSTDGNLFIFSNNRSLLLNPTSNKVVRTFPVLPGGSRNYPASGMSALLPIKLDDATNVNNGGGVIKAEVIVCGGNTHDSFYLAETQKLFLPALKDCNRMIITDPKPKWESEEMPSGRTMGDAMVLPNGQLLFINGAQKGTAGWWDADQPNFTPELYSPEKPKGQRFKVLKPTQISRMYHSTAAVLPNGKIWVAGSNTHDTYKDKDKFPTETRVEAFSPPYLDQNLDKFRPQIVVDLSSKKLRYGHNFQTHFSVNDIDGGNMLTKNDIKVTMYFPPFTTHGVNMNQRLLVLKIKSIAEEPNGSYKVKPEAPPSGKVAPPGYYLLFVVHRGVPSKGMWVHIQ